MDLRTKILNLLPEAWARRGEAWLDARTLRRLPRVGCDAATLRSFDGLNIRQFLEADVGWPEAERCLSRFCLESELGVNPGDQRALYQLVRGLKPASVLEVGTNVGAATLHLATAMATNGSYLKQLVSLDVVDVNDPATRVWEQHGMSCSPRGLMEGFGCSDWVNFVTMPTLQYLASCGIRFDFIFLNGNHSSAMVYQQIPAALQCLNAGGAILLHDYFPGLQPIWDSRGVIPGPWSAVERLRSEGAKIAAEPLGDLPWPTKEDSNRTSLALLVRAAARYQLSSSVRKDGPAKVLPPKHAGRRWQSV